jgi:hypothetical protein
MTQLFQFSNELFSAIPGVTVEETFMGEVFFPHDEEEESPYVTALFRDGVERVVPPKSVSKTDWIKFEARCIQEARDAAWREACKKEQG